MSKNSTTYTLTFAAITTVVCGVVLALAASSLKPLQEANKVYEKKSDILAAVAYQGDDIEEAYDRYITEKVVNVNGEEIEVEGGAFNINARKEREKPMEERNLPLFIFEKDDARYTIIPMNGSGLWGPIWGFVALDKHYRQIGGMVFDHQAETPGLGAEINTAEFQDRFIDKKVFDDESNFKPVRVLKGSGNVTNEHTVDGLSGATITCNGVTDMIENVLAQYKPYFEKNSKKIES